MIKKEADKMKKIISLILLTIMLFTFSACKDENTAPPKNTVFPNSQNTIGNSSTNIIKDGKIAYQDGWYYYYNGKGVYKIKTDGTERQQIYSSYLDEINIVGEWLYGSEKGCYKQNINTGEQYHFSYGNSISYLNVIDDWIYYYDTTNDGIYKMKPDGTESTLLLNTYIVDCLTIDGDWIYFFARFEDDGVNGLYKIKTDGTENTLLYTSEYFENGGTSLKEIYIVDDWIYFAKPYVHETGNKGIFRVKTDGSTLEPVKILNEGDFLEAFTVLGDHLIYRLLLPGTNGLKTYKSDINGNNEKDISQNFNPESFYGIYDYYVNDLYVSKVEDPNFENNYKFEFYNNNDELVLTIE
ncbi:MAG: DUF5050 domain-containing protein [Ruminococcaceae bacterium]|nr:DUF5050 domain-containing protein [Oscillospiraceae bacterium]